MPLILGANSVSGYTVKNSLRFENTTTDGLKRTITTSGNRQVWTWSGWVKRSKLTNTTGDPQILFNAGENTAGILEILIIRFNTDDKFFVVGLSNNGATTDFSLTTNAVYRDVSAWYHVVVAFDSTQATASNRVKIYINGVQETSLSATYPSLNYNSFVNFVTRPYYGIGDRINTSGQLFAGYMSEIYMIDGQALTPSSFGETDFDTGIWKPKAYTGTYGTNGFFLKFANSASLGTDSSGNGNNFTVNNLTSIDQTTDTPTNNFCTINILTCNDTATLTASEGNLSISGGNDIGATFGITKGKWYWESKRTNTGTVAHWGVGFTNSWYSSTQIVTGNGSGIFIRNDFVGGYNVNNSGSNGFTTISGSTSGSSIANGDIVGIALDLDSATKSITFYQNGSSVGSGTFSYDGTSSICFPFVRNNSGASSQWNFGNPPYTANGYTDGAGYGNFSYSVPSGFYSLNTRNLAQFG